MTFVMRNPSNSKFHPTGISLEASIVSKRKSNSLYKFLNDSIYLQKMHEDNLRKEFNELKDRWVEETLLYSNPNQIYDHPNYQQILDMGEEVVPFIIEDLKKNDHLWFHALQHLTGQNPIKNEHRGDFNLMKQDWIDWYETNY